jgi:branched-chain amino acid transport system substrate-binding protein
MRHSVSKKYLVVFVAFVAIFALTLSGCTKKPEEKREKVIKIGVIGPFTGEGATYGDAMRKGISLAINSINEKGGIDGQLIESYYEDSQLTPKEGINAFNKLVQMNNIQAIIGAASSSVSLALAPLANKNEVVLYSPISTADSLKTAGEYFFRNIPPNRNQAVTAAYFIKKKLNKKMVVTLYENNDYGLNMANVFSEYFKKIGGTILATQSYESGQTNFRNVLIHIKSKNPEVIYVPGTYQENALILRQAREMGISSLFIGGDGAYSPQLIKIAAEASEGFYLTLLTLNPNSQKVKIFNAEYNRLYKEDPNIYAALSYDALEMIALSLKKCFDYKESCSGEDIKNNLLAMKYEGVTGVIQFDEFGEPRNRLYSIYTVQNKKFIPLNISGSPSN